MKNYDLLHRSRARDKMMHHRDSLRDYEVLELLLFTAIARKDVKDLAKSLLFRFKTVMEVLNASYNELISVKGIGPKTAYTIKTYNCVADFWIREKLFNDFIVIDSEAALLQFCKKNLALEAVEKCYLFFLNSKNRLIEYSLHSCGDKNSLSIYISEIIKTAATTRASSIVIAHNHPSGNPEPSKQDRVMTIKVEQALNLIDVELLDHLVIGKNAVYSILRSEYL